VQVGGAGTVVIADVHPGREAGEQPVYGTGRTAAGYARALTLARAADDPLLESYVVRHQGGQALDDGDHECAVALARRSLQLRAACGARPHVAAAQALLADALGETEEAAELRSILARTADELDLAWLKRE
jgi:hypothetical protein